MAHMSLSGRTDGEILEVLGARLRALRKLNGLTQQEAGDLAEVSRRTVVRTEAGENPQLGTVVRLLRVYGRLDALDAFIPEPTLSPMQMLRRRRREERGG